LHNYESLEAGVPGRIRRARGPIRQPIDAIPRSRDSAIVPYPPRAETSFHCPSRVVKFYPRARPSPSIFPFRQGWQISSSRRRCRSVSPCCSTNRIWGNRSRREAEGLVEMAEIRSFRK